MLVLIQAFVLLELLRHLERMSTSRWHFSHLPPLPRLPNTPPFNYALDILFSLNLFLSYFLHQFLSLFVSLSMSLFFSHSPSLSLTPSPFLSLCPPSFHYRPPHSPAILSLARDLLSYSPLLTICMSGSCAASVLRSWPTENKALPCVVDLGKRTRRYYRLKCPLEILFPIFEGLDEVFSFVVNIYTAILGALLSALTCCGLLLLPVIEIKIDAFFFKKEKWVYPRTHTLSLFLVIYHSWRNDVKENF